jgi:hypothetical protein
MRMFPPEGGVIRSGINRWSDCIGQDRDSSHLGTLSTILQHFTHTMKPSDPLLLADVTLRCGMYPASLSTLPLDGQNIQVHLKSAYLLFDVNPSSIH